VPRTLDDVKVLLATEFLEGIAIEFEHLRVVPADDEQGRCLNLVKHLGRHVDATAARDDGVDIAPKRAAARSADAAPVLDPK